MSWELDWTVMPTNSNRVWARDLGNKTLSYRQWHWAQIGNLRAAGANFAGKPYGYGVGLPVGWKTRSQPTAAPLPRRERKPFLVADFTEVHEQPYEYTPNPISDLEALAASWYCCVEEGPRAIQRFTYRLLEIADVMHTIAGLSLVEADARRLAEKISAWSGHVVLQQLTALVELAQLDTGRQRRASA